MVSNCAKCLAFTWSRLKYEQRVLLTEETSSEHNLYWIYIRIRFVSYVKFNFTKNVLLQVIHIYRSIFSRFIIATCRIPGLENLASCEAAKYVGTVFATIQSIVDLAFIQVLLDFQRLNMLFLN